MKAKLRLSLGVRTSVSPFVTLALDSVLGGPAEAGCGEKVDESAWAQPRASGRAGCGLALPRLGRWKLAPLPVSSVRSVTIDGQVWGLAEASAPRFWSPSSKPPGCGFRD